MTSAHENLSDKLIYGPGEGPPWPRLLDDWDEDWDRLIVGRRDAGGQQFVRIGQGSAICHESVEIGSQKELSLMLKRLRRVVEALGWEWPGGF